MARKPTKAATAAPAAPAASAARSPRSLRLGDLDLMIPPLPLRLNVKAYPIVVQLMQAGFVDRLVGSGDSVIVTGEDFEALVQLAGLATEAAGLSIDITDQAVPLPDLIEAFFVMRLQTGAWESAA